MLPAAERTLLPAERASALLEVIACSGFPTQLLVIAVLQGFGLAVQTPGGQLSGTFVFWVSMIDAVLVIGLVLMLLRAHHESARDVLIGRGRTLREIGLGLVLIPVVFMLVVAVAAIVLQYAPHLRNVPRNPFEDLLANRTSAAVFAVVVMVAGGVREEVQRGFIIHRFDGYLGGGAQGVVIYSVLFGLGHYEQGWDAAIATALLGATWGTIYLRRRSIIAPVISHAGFNLAQVVKGVMLRGV